MDSGRQATKLDLHGIFQLLRGSHLNCFLLKALKLGWVAFNSVTVQLKCLDFQSKQNKNPVPVPSGFCNWIFLTLKSQRLPPFNLVTTSCILTQIVPLNIKYGRMV